MIATLRFSEVNQKRKQLHDYITVDTVLSTETPYTAKLIYEIMGSTTIIICPSSSQSRLHVIYVRGG